MSEGKRAGVEAEVGDRKERVVSFAASAGMVSAAWKVWV